MKITTRRQLTEEVARRIYEDFRIMDMEDTTDADRNWKMAEGIVATFLDPEEDKYLWMKERKLEELHRFDSFIRNYEENATDKVIA